VRPELDADGAAAPPRANGELVFDEPWQGRLFATTMAACEAGLIDYDRFRDHLIARVACQDDDGSGNYWTAWQDAMEMLAVEVGLVDERELGERAAAFSEHS
jgi:Nitrile hydratase beta subunit, N-terminal